jgi:hypothetical protein
VAAELVVAVQAELVAAVAECQALEETILEQIILAAAAVAAAVVEEMEL